MGHPIYSHWPKYCHWYLCRAFDGAIYTTKSRQDFITQGISISIARKDDLYILPRDNAENETLNQDYLKYNINNIIKL